MKGKETLLLPPKEATTIHSSHALFSRKSRDEDNAFVITVAGLEPKVGATHLALSLAAKLSTRTDCGLIVPEDTFEALNQYYFLSTHSEGVGRRGEARRFARIGGLTLMSGVLPGDISGFSILVWDCGNLVTGQRCFARGDLACLVAGGQAWELTPLNAYLMTTPYKDLERVVLCLRGIEEEDYRFLQQQMAGKLRCVQVLHKPNWADSTLREDVGEVLKYAGL